MNAHVAPPARRGTTRLPDGRNLGWSEWGSPAGSPVLFVPGAATSSALGFGADVIDTLHVRLIGLDRAGLGGSDPAPSWSFREWTDDVRDLCASGGLACPPMVGFSQGAPFALACAAAGVVRAVAIVSGTDELAAPRLAALLPIGLRELIERVATHPQEAESIFAAMRPDTMRQMVLDGSSPEDRTIYVGAVFDRLYRRALDEGIGASTDGYARDTVLAMSEWPFALDAITVPVDIWYGALDTSPVHSPDLGRSLASRIPTARRTVIERAGAAVLWTHAADILDQLLAHGSSIDYDKRKPS